MIETDAVSVVRDGVGVRLLIAEAEGAAGLGRTSGRPDVDDALAALARDFARLRPPQELAVEGEASLERSDDKIDVVRSRARRGHFGSTGKPASSQAVKPPRSASARYPISFSRRATRALVASPLQVQ